MLKINENELNLLDTYLTGGGGVYKTLLNKNFSHILDYKT